MKKLGVKGKSFQTNPKMPTLGLAQLI